MRFVGFNPPRLFCKNLVYLYNTTITATSSLGEIISGNCFCSERPLTNLSQLDEVMDEFLGRNQGLVTKEKAIISAVAPLGIFRLSKKEITGFRNGTIKFWDMTCR